MSWSLYVLTANILPYWLRLKDTERGGFYGQVTGDEQVHPDAPRSAVMYGRLLWTFSAAYRVTRNPEYLDAARWTQDYIERFFFDPDYGGVYWSVTADGEPLDAHKQFYAQAFMLYGYSELVRATGDKVALRTAISLFRVIEEYGRDREHLGYIEAASRSWQLLSDMRLSDKDENTIKSQNTNLHVMEAYTAFYRVYRVDEVRAALTMLIDTFTNLILQPSGHLGLFFDETWHPTSLAYSAGHDIECSWLIDEAAEVVGMDVGATVSLLAESARADVHTDGSVGDGEWWNQAEAVVGYLNYYGHTHRQRDLDMVHHIIHFIDTHLIDYQHGEWYWRVNTDGSPDLTHDKAGFWKCPYHSSRMCIHLLSHNL